MTSLEKGLGTTVLALVGLIAGVSMVWVPKYQDAVATSKLVFDGRAALINDLNSANIERMLAETSARQCRETIRVATTSPLQP